MKTILYILKAFLISHIIGLSAMCTPPGGAVQKKFYEAACRGKENDLEFMREHIQDYSFQQLKKVLRAQKIGKKIPMYIPELKEYYEDDAYEPFGQLLKKFPPLSAAVLNEYLLVAITATITMRKNNGYGRKEIKWLAEELKGLRVVQKDFLAYSSYRYRSGSL